MNEISTIEQRLNNERSTTEERLMNERWLQDVYTITQLITMNKQNKNIVLNGFSGTIAKQIVVKQYKKGTVFAKYPDRSHVKPSDQQLKDQSKFAKAVAFAKAIISDPVEKQKWQEQISKDTTVFQAAISWYMKNN